MSITVGFYAIKFYSICRTSTEESYAIRRENPRNEVELLKGKLLSEPMVAVVERFSVRLTEQLYKRLLSHSLAFALSFAIQTSFTEVLFSLIKCGTFSYRILSPQCEAASTFGKVRGQLL